VGPGFGKWGVLAREYLEVYGNKRFEPKTWKVRIDAIEANQEYMNIIKDFVYDHIYWTPVQEYIKHHYIPDNKYDLILILDVIEHVTKQEGIHIIKYFQEHSNNIMILTPSKLSMTHSQWNHWEDHKCVWSLEEFASLGFQRVEKLSHGPILATWERKS